MNKTFFGRTEEWLELFNRRILNDFMVWGYKIEWDMWCKKNVQIYI